MGLKLSLFCKIIALALAYFVTGIFGLQLSLPPGFATSFWPAAGVALAGLLVFGIEVWPGILIGAFFVNIIPQIIDNHNANLATIFLPCLIPAFGTALQAIAGQKLIHRFIGRDFSLNEERTVAKFLLLGGPLACTVSATIAVTSLCVFGLQAWSSFAFTWGTWWVGDSIGVMIIAPMLLMASSSENKKFAKNNLSVLVPSLFVLLVAIGIYIKVSQWEQEKVEKELKVTSDFVSDEIEERLGVYLEVLRSIEGLFNSSEDVTKEEFKRFVQGPLKRYHGLRALSWDVRVRDADKDKLLKKLRGENVTLKEMSDSGRAIPARKMAEYMIPLYIEPEKENAEAIGFNLYSDESRKRAIQGAIAAGLPTVTDRIRLIQDPDSQYGFLIVLPIFKRGQPVATIEDRQKNSLGVVVGVLNLEDFLNVTLAGYDLSGINFEIEDVSAPVDRKILYASANYYAKEVSSRDLNWNHNIKFANREWKINFKKSYAALLENRPWQAWFVLATGMMFAGLFTSFLMVIIGRTSRIEDLVEKRTEELNEAKSYMISASKMSALGEMAGGMAHEINTPLTIINLKVAQIQNELTAPNINFEKVNDGLNKIEDTVARIAKIIKGLRYFARDAKSDPFETAQVSQILDDTLYLCIERLRHNGIILKSGPFPTDLYIDCRPTEISQVILNLLNNSCDAVMDLDEKWISIEVVKVGKNLEIWICDSGSGIPGWVQEKIMQPFFTTKPVGKGTGLGLSISKGIIESHKGTLTIDNSAKNTCFVISLPIHQDKT